MVNRILTADGWQQRVRDKLGIDVAYLHDSVIQQPEIITVAEANIIEQVPDYSNLLYDKKIFLEAAVICECASLLCPSISTRLPAKESGPHESHELVVDWDKKKAEFEIERNGYIGKIIPSFSPLLHFRLSN